MDLELTDEEISVSHRLNESYSSCLNVTTRSRSRIVDLLSSSQKLL